MDDIAPGVQEASAAVAARTSLRPTLGVVLGSGLGAFAKELSAADSIPFADIPHFPRSTVTGHAGRLVVGHFAEVPILVMAGRVHAYEGYSAQEVAFPIRVLGSFGIKTLVVTNAAGAVNTAFRPGELMVITDHLNLTGANPLVGPEEKILGPRFPDMTEAYPRKLRELCEVAARRIGLRLRQGVYAGLLGPSYETPAEIRMLRVLGADAVGMSTVLEVVAANQMGMRVLGISCLSNMAAGILPKKLDHREVMETGERVGGVFLELLREVLPMLEKIA
ncbi:MAG: purine-nucleoside phosphorylase [Acidobacteriota bacterium]